MGYILFDIHNIKESCKKDIKLYVSALLNAKDVQESQISEKLQTYGLDDIDLFDLVAEPQAEPQSISHSKYLQQIDAILRQMDLKGMTYLDKFHEVDESAKEKLWILRTLLLCNILIIATIFMTDSLSHELIRVITDKYSGVPDFYTHGISCFPSPDNHGSLPKGLVSMFPDPKLVSGLNKTFKLGNFGSYKTTSDIDLGLILNGSYSSEDTSHMADVIWLVEGLFIVLTGWDTLQYDIELYGDMLTIEKDGVETFYLDTSDFEEVTPLLPSVYYSVARNQLMGQLLSDPTVEDQKGIKVILDSTNTDAKLLGLVKDTPKTREITQMIGYLTTPKGSYQEVLGEVASNIGQYDMYEGIKQQMKGYLLASRFDFGSGNVKYVQTPYGRYLYYAALLRAEMARISFLNMPKHTHEETIDIIILISVALSYRMEDYTSICTVEHVVRTIQANQDTTSGPVKRDQQIINNIAECRGARPDVTARFAICMLGKVGLTLSIIEQIGFMHRFLNDYCEPEPSDKCLPKLLKYQHRIIHAMKLLNTIRQVEYEEHESTKIEPISMFGGGKNTKKYKLKNKNKKTKKIKKIKKNYLKKSKKIKQYLKYKK